MKQKEIIEIDENTKIEDLDDLSFENIVSSVRLKGQGTALEDEEDDDVTLFSQPDDLSKLFGDTLEDEIEEEDEEEEEEEVKTVKQTKSTKAAPVTKQAVVEEDDDIESDYVGNFVQILSEDYDWEIDEANTPKTIEDFVNYIDARIQAKSVPSYANDQIAELDEYVRNGGRIEDYVNLTNTINFDNIDVENENTQRRLVKEMLKSQGVSESRIDKRIEKYEDAGILEDEAEEALEYLKEYAENQKQALLEEQKAYKKAAEDHQKKFTSSVMTEIETLKDIRGISISEKEKRAVLEYIFKPNESGVSELVKAINENPKALIEAAYFLKNADKVITSAQKKGESTAVNRLRDKLKSSSSTARTKQKQNAGYVPFSELF